MTTARAGLVVCAALVAAPAAAAEEIDVYGRLDLSLQHADEATESFSELKNNASRVGVKGEFKLKEGLTAIYQLEFGVDLDDEVDGTFTDRNQFVALQGTFGAVRLGRHDTALKASQGAFDLFDDHEGDITEVFNGEVRLNDYVAYVTPTFAGAFTATVNFFPGEDPEAGNDGVADAASASLAYDKDQIYAAIAHDVDVEGEDVETTRLVGGYTFGDVRIMLLYQKTETEFAEEDGFGTSVAWTFGDNTVKFQYLAADIWRLTPQADPFDNRLENSLSVGFDHKLAKNTKLFGLYRTGDIGGTSEKAEHVAIGIQQNF
ncbi:MAG TPA: porin [Vicinamibacterales bacterium]|nr:porin [Vicinamibacterales bacterium]